MIPSQSKKSIMSEVPSTEQDTICALRKIYANELSDEDFARLYKGKLAEIIAFVAQSLRGRTEAASARNVIQE